MQYGKDCNRFICGFGIGFGPLAMEASMCMAKEKNSGKEVYVPKDLDDCFVQLEKLLKS